jgi:hypothetical protein
VSVLTDTVAAFEASPNLATARAVIEAVQVALPDHLLPEPDRIEGNGEDRIAWFGGRGYYPLSYRRRDAESGEMEPHPTGHRERGAYDAIEGEAITRLALHWTEEAGK